MSTKHELAEAFELNGSFNIINTKYDIVISISDSGARAVIEYDDWMDRLTNSIIIMKANIEVRRHSNVSFNIPAICDFKIYTINVEMKEANKQKVQNVKPNK